jgi:hypothetical protein
MSEETTVELNVGKMLFDFYQKKRVPAAEIARCMNVTPSTISYHQSKPILSTGIILNYSIVMRHNFFMDIAAKLPKDFTTDAPQSVVELAEIADLKNKIAAMKQEFDIVKAERDLLKEIMIGNGVK